MTELDRMIAKLCPDGVEFGTISRPCIYIISISGCVMFFERTRIARPYRWPFLFLQL
jgi:hypothetical protein